MASSASACASTNFFCHPGFWPIVHHRNSADPDAAAACSGSASILSATLCVSALAAGVSSDQGRHPAGAAGRAAAPAARSGSRWRSRYSRRPERRSLHHKPLQVEPGPAARQRHESRPLQQLGPLVLHGQRFNLLAQCRSAGLPASTDPTTPRNSPQRSPRNIRYGAGLNGSSCAAGRGRSHLAIASRRSAGSRRGRHREHQAAPARSRGGARSTFASRRSFGCRLALPR